MRIKGKILIILSVIMVVPIILISSFFVIILRLKFNYDNSLGFPKQERLTSIDNSVKFINRYTEEDYENLSHLINENEDLLNDNTSFEELENRLSNKYTYLFLMKDNRCIYYNNSEIYEELKDVLFSCKDHDNRVSYYYRKNDKQLLIRGLSKLENKGVPLRLFMVSDISKIDEDSRKAISEIFYSIVFSLFLAGMLLVFWLDKTLLKPIKDLREMTKLIVRGDLDTEIRRKQTDEVSELCNDFDDMRIHIKRLLEQNLDTERFMRELMVNISHDLRTPLTAIKGYTMGLMEGVASTPSKQEKYLEILGSKADEMDKLIEELSTFAKLDLNYVPYQFIKIKLDDYLSGLIKTVKTDFELEGIQVSYKRNLPKDTFVWIDPAQFDKVMSNIFSNAKKYRNPDVQGILHIETFGEGKWIKITIKDNGKGIKKEHLSKVFERFYRVETSRNAKSGGSGLGLAIAKKIIEKHNGGINIESEFGIGTKLNIFIMAFDEKLHKLEEAKNEQNINYRG